MWILQELARVHNVRLLFGLVFFFMLGDCAAPGSALHAVGDARRKRAEPLQEESLEDWRHRCISRPRCPSDVIFFVCFSMSISAMRRIGGLGEGSVRVATVKWAEHNDTRPPLTCAICLYIVLASVFDFVLF
ncbi:hypothetical protein TraAM80_10511 [Trypanosoma rangeli]|uniref:Uncharacterized protein n=1 Tax=Trypanosoma rangeli TaxID=5698 RepID=A0A422MNW3_TRYRA|nr:uncharacterized protein TraAM80_10511 [Trypanosoma rangeli]RNE94897.1 hypothetical protein TraAM80_10511 [Trypanosoma rangeli]|eukprot:RNE94897.1 hypothetical protein TraAM80_10511 [Trypanosoma rangeli]